MPQPIKHPILIPSDDMVGKAAEEIKRTTPGITKQDLTQALQSRYGYTIGPVRAGRLSSALFISQPASSQVKNLKSPSGKAESVPATRQTGNRGLKRTHDSPGGGAFPGSPTRTALDRPGGGVVPAGSTPDLPGGSMVPPVYKNVEVGRAEHRNPQNGVGTYGGPPPAGNRQSNVGMRGDPPAASRMMYWIMQACCSPAAVKLAEKLGLQFPDCGIEYAYRTDLRYPMRRLIVTGHDTPENFALLFGSADGLENLHFMCRCSYISEFLGSPEAERDGFTRRLDEGCPFRDPRQATTREIEEAERQACRRDGGSAHKAER